MSDMKPKGTKIEIGGREFGLRFTLNAIDDIQDHFDTPISELGLLLDNEKTRIKTLRYLLTVLINEDIDCIADETSEKQTHVNERWIGRNIDLHNAGKIVTAIAGALSGSMPETEDEIPNATSGQKN